MSAYLGRWQLVPELSHYEAGEPPESGAYLIESKDGEIHFDIHWVATGQPMSINFSGPADGRQVPSDFPGVDSFSVLHEDDYTLSGDALAGGVQVYEKQVSFHPQSFRISSATGFDNESHPNINAGVASLSRPHGSAG